MIPSVGLLCALLHAVSGSSTHASTLDIIDTGKGDRPSSRPGPDPAISEALDPGSRTELQQALAAFAQGRFEDAERLARPVTESVPTAAEGWYVLGLALANLERFDDALIALQRAGDLYEENAGPLIVKADILLSLGRRDAARRAFEQAADRDDADWRADASLAQMAEADGATEDAIRLYRQALTKTPEGHLDTAFELAELHLQTGDAEAALALLSDLVRESPDSLRATVALARAQALAGQATEAADNFETATDIDPDKPRLWLERAAAHEAAGQFEAALSALTSADTRFPGDADILFQRGRLHAALRDYDAAARTFTQGLEARPEDRRLLKSLSMVHHRVGDIGPALNLAQTLVERADSDARDHLWLAGLRERAGDEERAIAAYEEALARDPDLWIAANNLAALLAERSPDRAVALAETALAASGEMTTVRDTLAWALFKDGQTDRALSEFAQVATQEKDNPRYAYRYGQVLMQAGKEAAGREQLSRALELDPSFTGADHARRLLGSD